MKTTIEIDADLLKRASELTGIVDQSALVNAALKSVVQHESALRLAALRGTEKDIKPIPRRRSPISEHDFG